MPKIKCLIFKPQSGFAKLFIIHAKRLQIYVIKDLGIKIKGCICSTQVSSSILVDGKKHKYINCYPINYPNIWHFYYGYCSTVSSSCNKFFFNFSGVGWFAFTPFQVTWHIIYNFMTETNCQVMFVFFFSFS